MAKVSLRVNLSVAVLREGKRFIAYAPALDLSTSGRTHEEARRRFAEAVKIFFDEVAEKGTIAEALKELGWTRTQSRWIPPTVVSHETESIRVPVHA